MQCEIRALGNRRESGRNKVSDTLPKPGRVNEVCKEWLVHEDGALAYQLQQKEACISNSQFVLQHHDRPTTPRTPPVFLVPLEAPSTKIEFKKGVGPQIHLIRCYTVMCSYSNESERILTELKCMNFELRRLHATVTNQVHLIKSNVVDSNLTGVQEHYSGNRSRNAIVREDFPKALDEQKREEEEAMMRYLEMTRLQEERDARLAKDFAQRINLEEEEKLQRRLLEDETIASQIQEKEMQRTTKEAKVRHLVAASPALVLPSGGICASSSAVVGDVNSVGLPELPPPPPLQPSTLAHASRSSVHHQHLQHLAKQFRALNADETDDPELNDLDFQEEMMRQMQEKKDEEFAKMLQEQEEGMDSLGMLDRDRLLAIEAQDKELAKLLQDRERAKAKRARERAKQRALLKKQQQQQESNAESAEGCSSSSSSAVSRPNNLDVIRINKPKLPDPEELRIQEVAGGAGGTLPNIAMAIDPTYTPTSQLVASTTISSPSYSLPTPEFVEDDDSPVPPYMPIQGQRRTSSLEKKQKKNKRDGCKQQ